MLSNIAIIIGLFTLFATFFIDGHFWYLSILGLIIGIIDMFKQIRIKDGIKKFFSIIAIILNLLTLVLILIIFYFMSAKFPFPRSFANFIV